METAASTADGDAARATAKAMEGADKFFQPGPS